MQSHYQGICCQIDFRHICRMCRYCCFYKRFDWFQPHLGWQKRASCFSGLFRCTYFFYCCPARELIRIINMQFKISQHIEYQIHSFKTDIQSGWPVLLGGLKIMPVHPVIRNFRFIQSRFQTYQITKMIQSADKHIHYRFSVVRLPLSSGTALQSVFHWSFPLHHG